MKKIVPFLFILAGVLCFVSCSLGDDDYDWQDTIDKNIDRWSSTSLFLFFADADGRKSLVSYDDPKTWPIVSDTLMTDEQVRTCMSSMVTQSGYYSTGSVNSSACEGFSYCGGAASMSYDSNYGMPFMIPYVKVNNTGSCDTYLYIDTPSGIDCDTLTTKLHYAVSDGTTYTEIKSIYYNNDLVYSKGAGDVGLLLKK